MEADFNPNEETRIENGEPCRITPSWKNKKAQPLNRNTLIEIAFGAAPLGILEHADQILTVSGRAEVLKQLELLVDRPYENLEPGQKLSVIGLPFVDSPSVTEHLNTMIDPAVKALTEPLIKRIENWLKQQGFKVTRLIDNLTGLTYPVGVFRTIQVTKKEGVIHVDCFGRDGKLKADFRYPYLLEDMAHYQVSFNILLSDGGYEPDSLYTYNKFYNNELERFVLANGWQFPKSAVSDCEVLKYTPKVGDIYAFNTNCFHDVMGGSPLSKRVTFSCFGIYLPELDLFMLYN